MVGLNLKIAAVGGGVEGWEERDYAKFKVVTPFQQMNALPLSNQ